jgi:hypothetical protein
MAEAVQKEEDLVIVSDDPKVFEGEEGAPQARAKAEPEEDEDDDEEEETRLGAAEGDEDKDELHKRRKEERSQRRDRQRQARERDAKEMNFLRTRNEVLERRFSATEQRVTGIEVNSIDSHIATVKANLMTADQVISKAITQGKGEDAAEAMRIRDGLRDRLTTLTQAKATIAQRSTVEEGEGEQSVRRSQPSQVLINHAKAWTAKNSWWDPNGGDEDSLVVSAIDTALVNAGMDPTTAEYWKELTKRVHARLPHRAAKGSRRDEDEDDDEEPESRQKSRGPRFRTQGRERPLKKNEVYISPDRKAAMVDAGVWDDPVIRQRYLKEYARYDRENANA